MMKGLLITVGEKCRERKWFFSFFTGYETFYTDSRLAECGLFPRQTYVLFHAATHMHDLTYLSLKVKNFPKTDLQERFLLLGHYVMYLVSNMYCVSMITKYKVSQQVSDFF